VIPLDEIELCRRRYGAGFWHAIGNDGQVTAGDGLGAVGRGPDLNHAIAALIVSRRLLAAEAARRALLERGETWARWWGAAITAAAALVVCATGAFLLWLAFHR